MSEKIQIRRGTNAERLTVTLDQGEPSWTTDTKGFYVGDGSTVGGVLIATISGLYETGSNLSNRIDNLSGSSSFAHTSGTETIDGFKKFTNSFGIHVSGLNNSMAAGDITVDPVNYQLLDSQPVVSVDWNNYKLYENANVSVNWSSRVVSGNWQLATASIPASSTSAGTKGMMTISGSNLLICTGTNQWGKIAISTY